MTSERPRLDTDDDAGGGRATAGNRNRGGAREYVKSIMVAVILALALRAFILEAYRPADQCADLLYDTSPGDLIFVLKPTYLFSPPERGDLIMFSRQGFDYISRVVGLAGETLDVSPGGIRIDGKLVREPYTLVHSLGTYRMVIPERHVFVEPDNRGTLDTRTYAGSTYWGAIPYDEIKGKCYFRWWPLRRIGWIRTPEAQ